MRKAEMCDVSVYNKLRLEQQLCDAVLRVDGVEFHVHKIILCNCSTYFRSLFTHWSPQACRVYDIPDMSADFLRVFVEFVYTGSLDVTQENVWELFVAADRFDVVGILQTCCDFLEKQLTPQNCLDLYAFTGTFCYPELKDKAFHFMLRHFEEVVATSEDFLQLSVQQLNEITKSDVLSVKQEEKVYEAILMWVTYAPEERIQYFSLLIPNVRLALLDPRYILENVIENELVKIHPEFRGTALKTLSHILDLMTKTFSRSLLYNSLARLRLPPTILLAVGGWTDGSPTGVIESYNPNYDLWVKIPFSEETSRTYHGVVLFNGSLYFIGGFDGLERLSSVNRFDLSTCTWHEASPMHSRRCFISVTVMDGYIYAMGGHDGHTRLETAERYEPRTNQWSLIAPMHEKRSDAGCATLNGKVYICGGFNGAYCLATAECYSPITNQWTTIPSMSCRRSGIGVITYANQIFAVMGGSRGDITLCNVEFYDGKTQEWSDASSMNVTRSALSCCTVNSLSSMADYATPTSEAETHTARRNVMVLNTSRCFLGPNVSCCLISNGDFLFGTLVVCPKVEVVAVPSLIFLRGVPHHVRV
uniref:Kelch like family member 10 n=1 Tax=Nothobranchius furzeri TaxID=105023 RepID=A0A8C6PSE9_NOTFU